MHIIENVNAKGNRHPWKFQYKFYTIPSWRKLVVMPGFTKKVKKGAAVNIFSYNYGY
jgi:hypothetical protein